MLRRMRTRGKRSVTRRIKRPEFFPRKQTLLYPEWGSEYIGAIEKSFLVRGRGKEDYKPSAILRQDQEIKESLVQLPQNMLKSNLSPAWWNPRVAAN